jgi:hypothetical protein
LPCDSRFPKKAASALRISGRLTESIAHPTAARFHSLLGGGVQQHGIRIRDRSNIPYTDVRGE